MRMNRRTLVAILATVIAAALILSGGPAFFSETAADATRTPPPVLRVIPYRLQVDQPPNAPPFAVDVVQALRTALFVASAGPDDEVGADPAALTVPHLVLHIRPGRSEGYRLDGAVIQLPLGTLRPDTLATCGRGNLIGATPLQLGAAMGAHTAAYVECFRRFVDSTSRAVRDR